MQINICISNNMRKNAKNTLFYLYLYLWVVKGKNEQIDDVSVIGAWIVV